MAGSKLTTREGKVLQDIGSWEKEQLSKNPMKEFIPKQHKSNVKNDGMDYLYRAERSKSKTPHWSVKIKIDGIYYGTKSFYDLKWGGEDKAKALAIEYRDNKLKELAEQGIFPIDRRLKGSK